VICLLQGKVRNVVFLATAAQRTPTMRLVTSAPHAFLPLAYAA
jgi:hypothetical protein